MLKRFPLISCLGICCAITACHNKPIYNTEESVFRLMPASQTHITFSNKVVYKDNFNVIEYRNFYNGGGVAIGDVNNDGRPDVFFTSNQGSNKLYLNQGNWKFQDITAKAGLDKSDRWHTGVVMADVNADGWLDIYVSNSGGSDTGNRPNELYINQHNGTFREEAATYGLADTGLSTQAAFFDYDHDGDLDCFVMNNSHRSIGSFGYNRDMRNTRDPKNGDRLYRNDNGHFTDVSAKAGIYGSEIGFGLGINVADLNNDGWSDLYISNDFFERDYLYINQKNGTFKEMSDDEMGHMSQSSMGADVADINNDGNADIFTTDMLPESDARLKNNVKFDEYDIYNSKLHNDFHHQFLSNSLQLNNGDGTFSDVAQYAGVDATDWSWGALLFDFNNDGWKDLFVTNGISKDLTNQDFLNYFSSQEVLNEVKAGRFNFKNLIEKMPATPLSSYGFVNQHDLRFKNETVQLGLGTPGFSNGAAYGDLDGDGDLDLVVNNENAPAYIYRNTTNEKTHVHYLKIKLQGSGKNTFGYGAKVTIYAGGQTQTAEQMSVRGFESSVEPVLNFGLGKVTTIDSVRIIWPDMHMQVLKNVKPNTTLILQQSKSTQVWQPIQPGTTLFTNRTGGSFNGDSRHHENEYSDFDRERLITKMLSTEGPKLAVADINGDGLDDVYMGNAKNDTAKLFLQQHDGRFIRKPQYTFDRDKDAEAVGAEFYDIDQDGDQDLLVASGGNQADDGSLNLLPRLYINDGKGNFTRRFAGWPQVTVNSSCIRVNKKNGDIFLGGRSISGAYGRTPPSRLFRRDSKGNYTDVTAIAAPELLQLGMVTDAQWADVDGSGKNTLVVVGDWMPVTLLNYVNGRLQKTSEVANSSGWWNCLTVADIDHDGRPDLLAGNNGINSKIKADAEHPAQLYISDFDHNGQIECVPVYYKSDNKPYLFNLHDDLLKQMPYLKKKFLRYDTYAGKGIREIFTSDELDSAQVLTVTQPLTCMFLNKGKQQFTMQPLPARAQLSPVFSILAGNFNNDPFTDLLLGGNFFGTKPEVGRYDASYGVMLAGTAGHKFNYLPSTRTGIKITGEVRDIKPIKTAAGTQIMVARNNDPLLLYRHN